MKDWFGQDGIFKKKPSCPVWCKCDLDKPDKPVTLSPAEIQETDLKRLSV